MAAYKIEMIAFQLVSATITLVDGYKQAGIHSVNFNALAKASGIYFYRLQVGDYTESKRMVLLK